VSSEQENLGRWLLQLLYDNYDNYVEGREISKYLEIDEPSVLEVLDNMVQSDLVESSGSKYRLSEKGYMVAFQRVTSFCPHL
jgi:predicted transcriptional regulator